MNMLARGQAALNSRMKASAGVTVTYTRGTDSVELTAWVGRTVFKRNAVDSAAVLFGERDYLIEVADLVLSGVAVTPKKGDRIAETIDGTVVTFELTAPADEPVWRYSDQTRTVYRVHNKRV